MKKIIIPTDFSENAFSSLTYAAELFKYERSEFFLLHAYADEVYGSEQGITPEFVEEQKKKVKEKADKQLATLKIQILNLFPNPKHTFHTISAFGLLIDEVNDLAEGS